ncbi:Protein abhd12b [Tyrophagus putrescentiae]|nr:Protein abhd12b [Tyrophagus putrescentiae]
MLLLFLLFLLVLFTAIIPVLFRFSLLIQRGTVFMNIVNFSLRTPEGAGLRCTRNWLLHLKVPFRNNVINNNNNNNNKETQSIHLGVWHNLHPKLNDGRLVVLYTHGMGGTRSSAHRVALYKLLSNKLNAHVLAFDYRGFGDSGPDPEGPRAEGLAQDTEALYRWLVEVEQVHPNKVLLWGHSMGTAVAIRFLSNLSSKAVETGSTSEHLPPPLATVLEAPFTSLREAIPVFPLAKIFSLLPHFNACFLEPLVGNHHLNFDSSVLMSRVSTPLLFFHAEDDRIVPYSLGRKLYNIALQEQPSSVQLRPSFVSFPRERHFGHKNIVAAGDELVRAVQSFLEAVRQQKSIA